MTVSLLHNFVDPASDLPGFAGVKPSNWNAQHTLTGAVNSLLGFDGSGNALDGNLYWGPGLLIGGTGVASTLTLESTSGAGTSDAIIFRTASQTEAMRIDTSQHVNIGNAGGMFVDLLGNNVQFQISAIATLDNIDVRKYSADTAPNIITATKSRGGSIGTATALNNADGLLEIVAGGYDATSVTPVLRQSGVIFFEVDGAPTVGSVPGRVRIATSASGSGTPTEAIRVDANQNVNIGNNQGMVSNVLGNTPQLQLSATHDVLDLRCFSTTAATGPNITSIRSHNATLNTNTAVVSGDVLLSLVAGGYDATGTPVVRQAGQIVFEADGTPTAGSVLGRMRFLTTISGQTIPSEAARIDTNQNVVISAAALATGATNGFIYVPTCAGVPTGTPTSYTGRTPLVHDTTHNIAYFYNGTRWQAKNPITAILTSDFTNATTSSTSVSGLTVNVVAGATYIFEACWLTTQASGPGTTINVGNAGSATYTNVIIDVTFEDALTINSNSRVTSVSTQVSTTTATNARIYMRGSIVVNAAGTIIPQAANAASGTGTTTVKTGSWVKLTQVS